MTNAQQRTVLYWKTIASRFKEHCIVLTINRRNKTAFDCQTQHYYNRLGA